MKQNQDIILGVVITLFACVMLPQAFKISESSAMYPKALLYIIAVSGILVLVEAFRKERKGTVIPVRITKQNAITEIVIPGSILLAGCLLLQTLGFYLVSFLVLMAISIAQDCVIEGRFYIDKKKLPQITIYSLGVTIFMFLAFYVLLSLPTPKGIFGI